MVLSTNIPYMANANDKFEDTKGEIRTYKFKKDRQYNGQKKKGSKRSNNRQNITQKTLIEIEQHEHHKKTGVHLGGPEGVKFLLHKLGYKHTIENV